MAQLNIYLPDEMKARMDAAEKRANWSAIAQRAFDLELNHIESIKEVSSMSDVIERLKSSKQNFVAEAEGRGRKLGVVWAKKYAEYEQLMRVSKVDTDNLPEDDDESSCYAAEIVYMEAEGDSSSMRVSISSYSNISEMAEFYGLDEDDFEAAATKGFVAGFVEGAAEVWEEVRGQI